MQRKIGQNRKEWYDYMKRLIYLDHAATTQPFPEVLDAMIPYYSRYYGNPSSGYELGEESKRAIETARGQIADTLGVEDDTIYFTSGGTESDNWALRYAVQNGKRRRPHIVTSSIEHHAILNTCKNLEKQGVRVTYLPVNKEGTVQPEMVERAIISDTVLVSVMYANNEIGSIQPIRQIGQITHRKQVLFHTDAVQAYGQIPIHVKEDNIDLLSASGHKFNGPKGTGFLYARKGLKLQPMIHGGGQERKMRAGTENVCYPAAAGRKSGKQDPRGSPEPSAKLCEYQHCGGKRSGGSGTAGSGRHLCIIRFCMFHRGTEGFSCTACHRKCRTSGI